MAAQSKLPSGETLSKPMIAYLQMRDQTDIRTIDPGRTWGGMDKNNFDADEVMGDSLLRHLLQSNI